MMAIVRLDILFVLINYCLIFIRLPLAFRLAKVLTFFETRAVKSRKITGKVKKVVAFGA